MCVRARVRVGAYVFVEYVRGSDARGTVANLEALLAGREVDGSDVKQLLAPSSSVILQEFQNRQHILWLCIYDGLVVDDDAASY